MDLPSFLRLRIASVGTKLAGATLLVIAIASGVVYAEVSTHARESRLSQKEAAAVTVTRLFVAGLTAPLTFADDRAAQEQTSLLMATDDVVYGSVWSLHKEDATPLLEKVGEIRRQDFAVDPPSLERGVRIKRSRERVFVESSIVDPRGAIVGVAQVAFSLEKENIAIRSVERQTLVGAATLAFGVSVVLLALTRTIIRRLARLAAAAKRFENGEAVDIDTTGSDEVSTLAHAFAAMTATIATREERISERNRDLRCVLDNVAEGFFTVDCAGVMSEERSRVVDDWFGAPTSNVFATYVERIAPEVAPWIRLGWAELADDFMPVEVILDQLAQRFERGGRSYEMEFRPIHEGDVLALVLVAIRDVTERVQRERAQQEQREAIAIFQRIVADRLGFDEFVAEASTLVEQIVRDDGTDLVGVARAIHTLKGVCGIFEVESVASFCHEVEQRMLDCHDGPNLAERTRLGALWAAVRGLRDQLGGDGRGERIELRRDEYARVLAELDRGADRAAVATMMRGWVEERATTRIERVSGQLRSIARRLGKANVEIRSHVSPIDLRLPGEGLAAFWTAYAHVLRNTLDHGIETPEERLRTNKSGPGVVSLSLVASHHGLELSIADDGRGIAWEKIRERALALGLPVATEADLDEALYTDSVSSKDVATEMSGRGVGLGALREVVRACGGSISIVSIAGAGTSLRVHFPVSMLVASWSAPDDVHLRTAA